MGINPTGLRWMDHVLSAEELHRKINDCFLNQPFLGYEMRSNWYVLAKEIDCNALEKDKCIYCGVGYKKMVSDHFVALAKGGKDRKANRVVACHRCNLAKSSRTIDEFRSYLGLKESGLSEIISLRTYNQLVDAGVDMPKLPFVKFYYETWL